MGAQVTDNIGSVERLMTTSIGAAMVGGKRIADAESARPCTGIGVCTISTRSDADQHTLATMPELDKDDESKLCTQIYSLSVWETPLENVILDGRSEIVGSPRADD